MTLEGYELVVLLMGALEVVIKFLNPSQCLGKLSTWVSDGNDSYRLILQVLILCMIGGC